MRDAFNEVIDRLVASGIDEYDAVALITQLLEQEAWAFVFFDDLFKLESYFARPDSFIN